VARSRKRTRKPSLYVGVDVGGTKVMAAVVTPGGDILGSHRTPTPRDAKPKKTVAAILEAIANALDEQKVAPDELGGIGLTIPGVVDPDTGTIVVTPNMNLTGVVIVPVVEERFGVPVAIGNDVNMGTLGEKWLGAARRAQSAVCVMVGTGIGGGVIMNGKLVRGSREAAGEVGHMIVEIGGPQCGCGNCGCWEALASRTAIERDIRQAVAAGKDTVATRLVEKSDGLFKSSVLRKALKAGDKVVTRIVRRASEVLGYGCLTIRHLLDPEVIILGGGVIEACGRWVLPVVREIVGADALPGARPGCYIAESELGDDAVVLGAVALAMEARGEDPMKVKLPVPDYPTIESTEFGQIVIGGKTYRTDVRIGADGKARKRNKKRVKERLGTSHKIDANELDKACQGHPDVLIIGTGQQGAAVLTADGEEYLKARRLGFKTLPTPEAAAAYNRAKGRRAAIFHLTC